MNPPPPELAWIGIIGGVVGILTATINLIIMWRNRRRIEFRVFSTTTYAEPWQLADLQNAFHLEVNAGKRLGNIKRAFIVVEFAIKNEYPTEITAGRFVIDRWMFSDSYHTGGIAYPLERNYRVFDLYKGEPTNLENYVRIPPRGSYALRLEVLEDTHERWSSHGRYAINLPKKYFVEYFADARKIRHKIKLQNIVTHEYFSLNSVHHWSDLLPDVAFSGADEARPQGITPHDYRPPLRIRLRIWLYNTKNRLLYGTPYHWPEQVSWVSKLRRIFRKHTPNDSARG
jgi:hypothetical protein